MYKIFLTLYLNVRVVTQKVKRRISQRRTDAFHLFCLFCSRYLIANAFELNHIKF